MHKHYRMFAILECLTYVCSMERETHPNERRADARKKRVLHHLQCNGISAELLDAIDYRLTATGNDEGYWLTWPAKSVEVVFKDTATIREVADACYLLAKGVIFIEH